MFPTDKCARVSNDDGIQELSSEEQDPGENDTTRGHFEVGHQQNT
jgi:hypothetical protein